MLGLGCKKWAMLAAGERAERTGSETAAWLLHGLRTLRRCCGRSWTTGTSWRLVMPGHALPMWDSGGSGVNLWDLCCPSHAPLHRALQRCAPNGFDLPRLKAC